MAIVVRQSDIRMLYGVKAEAAIAAGSIMAILVRQLDSQALDSLTRLLMLEGRTSVKFQPAYVCVYILPAE